MERASAHDTRCAPNVCHERVAHVYLWQLSASPGATRTSRLGCQSRRRARLTSCFRVFKPLPYACNATQRRTEKLRHPSLRASYPTGMQAAQSTTGAPSRVHPGRAGTGALGRAGDAAGAPRTGHECTRGLGRREGVHGLGVHGAGEAERAGERESHREAVAPGAAPEAQASREAAKKSRKRARRPREVGSRGERQQRRGHRRRRDGAEAS
jgi:hypothetical protein